MFDSTRLITLEQAHNIALSTAANYHDEVITVDRYTRFDGVGFMCHGHDSYALRLTAQKQISARLGIPFQYLVKCNEDVQSYNLNHWISSIQGKRLFLRMDGEAVRAIFTERYQPIDNTQITASILNTSSPETKVDLILDDNVMALNIPCEDKTFCLMQGDDYSPGISILNSETGYRSFSVEAFLLRLICTNGLITQVPIAMAKIRHVVRNFLKRFFIASVVDDVVTKAIDLEEDLSYALSVKYKEPVKVMQGINKHLAITSKENEAALWGLYLEPGNTLYHLINAYTKGAQFPGLSTESQYRLQKAGGMITGLAHQKHKVIDVSSYVVNG